MKRAGDMSELDKLLAASKKRMERVQAAEQVLSRPAAAPAPAPAPAPEPAAKAVLPSMDSDPTDVAPLFKPVLKPYAVPVLQVAPDDDDPLLAMLDGHDAESPSVKELLLGGWVRAHYAHDRACPTAVARWLFAVACHHRRAETSAAAARTLGALLDSSTSPSWVPRPSDFLVALRRHGADLAELLAGPAATTDPGAEDAQPAAATASSASTGASSSSATTDESLVDDPRQNLLATLELLAPCARRWAACGVGVAERLGAAVWIARLMLEKHTAPAFVHLQDAFAATLDGAAEAGWTGEWLPGLLCGLRGLCEALPHTAIVRVHEFLPPTLRASTVQRRAAIDAIGLVAYRRARQHGAEARAEAAQRKQQRKAEAEARKARRESGEEDDEDDEEEEDDDEDEDEEEDKEESVAAPEAPGVEDAGASALAAALGKVDPSMYKGRMDVLHSLLVLTNIALSAEPDRMRTDRDALEDVKRRLAAIKQRAQRYRGVIDYHGLECESLVSYLGNQIELLYLEGEE